MPLGPADLTAQKTSNGLAPDDSATLKSGSYWAELRVFLAVAKGRSFNKGAEILGISQPTVSRQVKRLEKQIQVKLVIPNPRGVRLTSEGEKLAKTLAELDMMLSTISDDLKSDKA